MIEAYRIGVSMFLDTNIASVLGPVVAVLENLDKIVKQAATDTASLGAALRGIARAEPGVRTLAASMERLHSAQDRAATSARALNEAIDRMATGPAARAADAAASAWRGAAPSAAGPRQAPPSAASSVDLLRIGGGTTGVAPYRPPVQQIYENPNYYAGPAGLLGGGAGGGVGGGGAGGGGGYAGPAGLLGGPGGNQAPAAGGTGIMAAPVNGFSMPVPPVSLNYRPNAPKPTSGEFSQAAVGFGIVGAALLDFTKSAVEARAEIEHVQSTLQTMGFTEDEASRALEESFRLQRTVPGMTVAGGMHIIQDTMSLLQKPDEAMDPENLNHLAQTAMVLQTAGKGDAIGELFKAIQAGELRGALTGPDGQMSQAGLTAFLRNVEATTVQTGGRVGPAEILQFLKSSNVSGAMLSDSALFADSIMPILSMGRAKAGNSLQAFSAQFSAGKMSEGTATLLSEMGFFKLDDLPQEYTKTGKEIPKVRQFRSGPGTYNIPTERMSADPAGARSEPYEFIEKAILPRIDDYLTAHGGKASTPDALMAQRMSMVQRIASRTNGGAEMGDVIRNFLLIERDREAISGAQGRDRFATREATDPTVKFQAASAALNGLMVALGGPIMDGAVKGINDITAVLNGISAWAEKHPETAGKIMEIVVVLGTLSVSVAAASLVFSFAGPMIKTFQWLASAEALAAASNVTAVGTAMAGLRGAAALGLAGLLTYGAGKGLQTAFSGGEDAIERALRGEGAVQRRHAEADAMDKFSMFDRSTWADPNGHWYNMSPRMPAAPGSAGGAPVTMQGTLNVDGRKLGTFTAQSANSALTGPNPGTTGHDTRVDLYGAMPSN